MLLDNGWSRAALGEERKEGRESKRIWAGFLSQHSYLVAMLGITALGEGVGGVTRDLAVSLSFWNMATWE